MNKFLLPVLAAWLGVFSFTQRVSCQTATLSEREKWMQGQILGYAGGWAGSFNGEDNVFGPSDYTQDIFISDDRGLRNFTVEFWFSPCRWELDRTYAFFSVYSPLDNWLVYSFGYDGSSFYVDGLLGRLQFDTEMLAGPQHISLVTEHQPTTTGYRSVMTMYRNGADQGSVTGLQFLGSSNMHKYEWYFGAERRGSAYGPLTVKFLCGLLDEIRVFNVSRHGGLATSGANLGYHLWRNCSFCGALNRTSYKEFVGMVWDRFNDPLFQAFTLVPSPFPIMGDMVAAIAYPGAVVNRTILTADGLSFFKASGVTHFNISYTSDIPTPSIPLQWPLKIGNLTITSLDQPTLHPIEHLASPLVYVMHNYTRSLVQGEIDVDANSLLLSLTLCASETDCGNMLPPSINLHFQAEDDPPAVPATGNALKLMDMQYLTAWEFPVGDQFTVEMWMRPHSWHDQTIISKPSIDGSKLRHAFAFGLHNRKYSVTMGTRRMFFEPAAITERSGDAIPDPTATPTPPRGVISHITIVVRYAEEVGTNVTVYENALPLGTAIISGERFTSYPSGLPWYIGARCREDIPSECQPTDFLYGEIDDLYWWSQPLQSDEIYVNHARLAQEKAFWAWQNFTEKMSRLPCTTGADRLTEDSNPQSSAGQEVYPTNSCGTERDNLLATIPDIFAPLDGLAAGFSFEPSQGTLGRWFVDGLLPDSKLVAWINRTRNLFDIQDTMYPGLGAWQSLSFIPADDDSLSSMPDTTPINDRRAKGSTPTFSPSFVRQAVPLSTVLIAGEETTFGFLPSPANILTGELFPEDTTSVVVLSNSNNSVVSIVGDGCGGNCIGYPVANTSNLRMVAGNTSITGSSRIRYLFTHGYRNSTPAEFIVQVVPVGPRLVSATARDDKVYPTSAYDDGDVIGLVFDKPCVPVDVSLQVFLRKYVQFSCELGTRNYHGVWKGVTRLDIVIDGPVAPDTTVKLGECTVSVSNINNPFEGNSRSTVALTGSWGKNVTVSWAALTGIGTVLLLLVVGATVCVVVLRDNPAIKATSVPMSLHVLLGLALFSSTLLTYGHDMVGCQAWFWLSNAAVYMTLTPLLLRNYRIHALFNSELDTTLARNQQCLSDTWLVAMLWGGMAATCAYLALWSRLYPLTQPHPYVCLTQGTGFIAGMTIMTVALMAAGVCLAWLTRNVPSNWNEARHLSLTVWALSAGLAVLTAAQLLIDAHDVVAHTWITAIVVVYLVLSVLGLFFVARLRVAVTAAYTSSMSRNRGDNNMDNDEIAAASDGSGRVMCGRASAATTASSPFGIAYSGSGKTFKGLNKENILVFQSKTPGGGQGMAYVSGLGSGSGTAASRKNSGGSGSSAFAGLRTHSNPALPNIDQRDAQVQRSSCAKSEDALLMTSRSPIMELEQPKPTKKATVVHETRGEIGHKRKLFHFGGPALPAHETMATTFGSADGFLNCRSALGGFGCENANGGDIEAFGGIRRTPTL